MKTFLIILFLYETVYAQEFIQGPNYIRGYRKEISLQCKWHFEIGDSLVYAGSDFDESAWDVIDVPECWENAGYPGYDGYGWYRIRIPVPKKFQNKYLVLRLGRINDVDEVYINGRKLNQWGYHGPFYHSASDMEREYEIPQEFLYFGQTNVIAVRVYDREGCGGIFEGPVGIYSRPENEKLLTIRLLGTWKFSPGDSMLWAQPDYNDSGWSDITVPCFWEHQGFPELDGLAWYRRSVFLGRQLSKKHLILAAGKINDVDEVYFNGVLIGRTGSIEPLQSEIDGVSTWRLERFYEIPNNCIRWDSDNVIAIRVYDYLKTGGIWYGPIGIATRDAHINYLKKQDKTNQRNGT
jgi:hypothetical protein